MEMERDGFPCKYACGKRGRFLEQVEKHEKFWRNRTKGFYGNIWDEGNEIGKIDRRKTANLGIPADNCFFKEIGVRLEKAENARLEIRTLR